MKRYLSLVLAFAIMLSFCAFSRTEAAADSGTAPTPSPTVTDNRSGTETKAVSAADFETRGTMYEDETGDTLYFAVVQNNGTDAARVTCTATALDASGGRLDQTRSTIEVIGPGETSFAVLRFRNTAGVAEVEPEYTYQSNAYYSPAVKDIEVSETLNDRNVVVKATNNGPGDAKYLQALVLFLDENDQVLGYGTDYIIDGDLELKPGVSLSAAFQTGNDYDHTAVYLTACSDGTEGSKAAELTAEQFEVEEYPYASASCSYDFISVKNNTDQAYGIYGNAVAKDASGAAVGAADLSIDVLGPGETQLGTFSFDTDAEIASVEYQLYRNKEAEYEPVVGSLSGTADVSDGSILVSVTNEGTIPAEFVQAQCLYLDENNKVVDVSSQYLVDEDDEIKTDATASAQLNTGSAYSSALIFLNGYGENDIKLNADAGVSEDGAQASASVTVGGITESASAAVDYKDLDTVIRVGNSAASAAVKAGTDAAEAAVSGVSDAFKATMDGYEAFFQEYSDFMQAYAKNPLDFSLIGKYSSMLSKYMNMKGQLNQMDTGSMTEAEREYYAGAMTRINRLLLDIG